MFFSRHASSRRVSLLVLCVGLCLVSDLSGQGGPSRARRTVIVDGREAIEGEVLIRFRTRPGGSEEARAAADVETEDSETIARNGLRRWRARRLGTHALIQRLRANPDVEFVEPNYVVRIDAAANDSYFGSLWGLFNSGQNINGAAGLPGADIGAPFAWEISTGTRDRVVAIVDTGIDYTHPDLAANVWTAPSAFTVTVGGVPITCPAGSHGFNAIANTCNPMDDHSHGTHVAGTIGAVGNNGIGITGVNWVASMMGLKFLSASGSGSTSDAIKAIDFAIQAKAAFAASGAADVRVLSNSWGGGGFSIALLDAINRANAADMLFVAAAGNAGLNTDVDPNYPSNYTAPNVISVAAMTNRDQRSSFSNYGAATVDLGAPGSAILSTIPNNSYAYYNGTSMATPHVSGAAALLLSACSLSTAALKASILSNVTPAAAMAGLTVTGGRLNVDHAIRSCPPLANPVPVITALSPPVWYAQRALTLTVDGRNFVRTSQVRIDGVSLPTTYQSPTRLTAAIAASELPALGARSISVYSPPPGGGASGNLTLSIQPPPSMRVNGTTVPAAVAPGAPLTVTVNGGPASRYDWITIAPVGSSDQSYAGIWFLNGSSIPPATGLSNATIVIPAPGEGIYEVRFLADGRYQRLATSAAITVAPPRPVPQISSLGTTAIAATSPDITVAVNGAGFHSSSQVLFDGAPRSTTFTSAASLSVRLPSSDLAGVGSHIITVSTPAPGGGTSNPAAFNVIATPGVPQLASISPASIGAGAASLTLTVTGSAFAPTSRVVVDGSIRATTYLSSTTLTAILPAGDLAAAGSRSITVSTPAPGGGASSPRPLAVLGPFAVVNHVAGAVTVLPGAPMSVAVGNGPANIYDWVTIAPVGSGDQTYTGIWFLNGASIPPAVGVSAATMTLPAPASEGNYEVRFLANGRYQRLATSAVITVARVTAAPTPAPALTLTVNGSSGAIAVAPGASLTVAITGGPANVYDWITIAPAGSSDQTYSGIWFLNNTSVPPAIGVSNATLVIPAPAANGQYEVRFLASGRYQRLATSGVVTVGTVAPVVAPAPSPASVAVNGSTGAVSVDAGSPLTIAVANGPASAIDWVTIAPVGSSDQTYTGIWFLNGSSVPPSTGVSSATFVIRAPATPGWYEVRFLANGRYVRLATSGVITVH